MIYKTAVLFKNELPFVSDFKKINGLKKTEQFVIFYDKKLKQNKAFAKWIKKWPLTYVVEAGEKLKDVRQLPKHMQAILKLIKTTSPTQTAFVSVGGGSVGDFTGFLASVFKRGVKLIHVPSTWLAAIDSAHGGKTALNVAGFKNQVGSYYFAEATYIVKSLLPQDRKILEQALSELLKIALIDGGELYKRATHSNIVKNQDRVWDLLPAAIDAKIKVVKKDPFEQNGMRQVLNLGHTVGHVLESYYHIPHGEAVGWGLVFSLHWSLEQGYLHLNQYAQILKDLHVAGFSPLTQLHPFSKPIPEKEFSKILGQDKKAVGNKEVQFIFLKKVGSPFRKTVTLKAVTNEAKRQGWIQ